MKTLAKLLYVEADEEITDLVDRLRDLSLEDEVTFVVPERARALQSAMSFRLLKRYADSYGKRVNLVSGDPRLAQEALAEPRVPRKLGREDLQRDASPALDVLSEKDAARRAGADQALDPEVGDQRPSLDLGRHLP